MSETTIQELTRLRDNAGDDFARGIFASVLACLTKAAPDPEASETNPGEMERCAKCDYLWPVEDLFAFPPDLDLGRGGERICPTCVIGSYYEARRTSAVPNPEPTNHRKENQ